MSFGLWFWHKPVPKTLDEAEEIHRVLSRRPASQSEQARFNAFQAELLSRIPATLDNGAQDPVWEGV